MPILKNIPVTIPEKNVLARLQYKKGITEIDAATQELFNDLGREALALIEPQGIYEIFLITSQTEDETRIEKDLTIHSCQVTKLLDGCTKVILLAGTIGPGLGERVNAYEKAGDLRKAAILDAFGSELADETADHLSKVARWQLSDIRAKPTTRYSPGYGDWTLDAQPGILAALDAARIGLTSNASHILIPEKSVTAIIGIRDAKIPMCEKC